MFEWGFNHGIGKKLSFFFIEWSNVCLKANNFDKAIEIIQNGIKSNALPLDDLNEKLKQINRLKSEFEKSNLERTDSTEKLKFDSERSQSRAACLNNDETHEKPVGGTKKFWFLYDLIKPDPKSEEEYSFEEVRARVEYKAYEKNIKCQSKYIEEINELKSK